MTRRFATIGVYGFDADSFMAALRAHGVDMLVDVRQRRGVRGAQYAWANSNRLQRLLADHRVDYEHVAELAPTTELRRLQYRQDAVEGVGKRNRHQLADAYRKGYIEQILDPADLAAIISRLPEDTTLAFFCVEAEPQACHRSLIADRIRAIGVEVVDIRPDA